MGKLWLVARHEFRRHVLRRSFVLAVLVVPAILGVVAIVQAVRTGDDPAATPLGVVDPGGILAGAHLAPELERFASEEPARAALDAGAIGGFALVPPTYPEPFVIGLTLGETPDAAALRALRDQLRRFLLASQSPTIVARALAGTHTIVRTPDGGREYRGSVTGGMVLPPLSGLFLLLLIFLGSGHLVGAVVEERSNRTFEVLATALPPGRLIGGKILGIVAATLTLLATWLVSAVLAVALGGLAYGGAWLTDLRPDPMAMLLMVVLVVPAYVTVAAGLTTMGAALSEARSGQQVTLVLMSTILGTVSLALPLMENPDSPLAVGLSLAPVFSTVLLPARNLFMALPAWEIVLGVGLNLACAAGALWCAGRALRASTSRFGGAVSWREILGQASAAPVTPPTSGGPAPAATTRRRSTRALGKTWLVARHEARTMLTRPLFVGLTLGLPLLLVVQLQMFDAATPQRSPPQPGALPTKAAAARPHGGEGLYGYVDPAGLVSGVPDDVPADSLRAFPDEPSAAHALAAGEIIAYSLIPPDYVARGELVVVRPDAGPLVRGRAAGALPWVLLVNVLGGDAALAARVRQPVELEARPLASAGDPEAASEESDSTAELAGQVVAMLTMLLLYAVVLLASGLLLRSVSDEKKSRTMELLLVSLSTRKLLAGKILGLGFVGLVQAAVWTACFVVGILLSGKASALPAGFDLGPSVVVWGALLFLFGYAVYSGLMASAGALVPDIDEARGVSFLLVVPALIGFVVAEFQMGAPHGPIMTGLSMFPLTAPFVMMLRLTLGGVPTWQLLVTLILMGVTSLVIVRATARMFRAQHLLSGQRFSFARYVAALRD